MKLPRIPKPSLDTLDAWRSYLIALALQCIAAIILFLMV